MKKNYMAPALFEQLVQAEQMIAASANSQIGGNSGITMGTGEAPTEADVKGNPFGESIFE